MKLELEDLTKEELISLIKKTRYSLPNQRELLNVRWERLSGEAQRIREQSIQESQKWIGIKTPEAYEHWRDAQLLFDKGMALDDKADIIFKELSETRDKLPS